MTITNRELIERQYANLLDETRIRTWNIAGFYSAGGENYSFSGTLEIGRQRRLKEFTGTMSDTGIIHSLEGIKLAQHEIAFRAESMPKGRESFIYEFRRQVGSRIWIGRMTEEGEEAYMPFPAVCKITDITNLERYLEEY